jgi:hypothetical protein
MEWLDNTHYSGPRKKQLIQLRLEMPDNPTERQLMKAAFNKCFVKPEGYLLYKPGRGIMSRSDFIKCWIGPLIKKCENMVYDMPEFIKHVKCHDRSAFVRDHMQRAGCVYAETDYTSFEGAMRDKIMNCCEFTCLRWLCRLNSRALERLRIFENICTGVNVMRYTDITARIKARRMSGEMTTSFGNGWTNMMLATFVLRDVAPNAPILVEGDDGIVTLDPALKEHFTKEAFAKLGFTIKIEWHEDISETGFCGIVCEPNDGVIITDPISAMASLGWCSGAALRANDHNLGALLRAKSLSLAYQYPGCPILLAMARLGIRVAHGLEFCSHARKGHRAGVKSQMSKMVDNPFFDVWHKDILVDAEKYVTLDKLNRQPSDAARSLMARKYGISFELQLRTERYLDSIHGPCALHMPWLIPKCTPAMVDAAEYFVRSYPAGTPWYNVAKTLN